MTGQGIYCFLFLTFLLFSISVQEDANIDGGSGNTGDDHPLIECETTKGSLVIEVIPQWSPLGAQRFLELIDDNFYTNIAFYRCVKRFLVQFGITENPSKRHWHHQAIKDDPNLHLGIKKNYISFAGGGPNTRTTQLFIAFEDLDFLGKEPWETPFGRIIKGQETLDHLYKEYGDIPPFGNGPDQSELFEEGNEYIHRMFPKIDFLHTCSRLAISISEEKQQESLDQAAVAAVVAAKGGRNSGKTFRKKKDGEGSSSEATDNDDGKDLEQEKQLALPQEEGIGGGHLLKEEDIVFIHQEDPNEGGEKVVVVDEPPEEKPNLRLGKKIDASAAVDPSAPLLQSATSRTNFDNQTLWQLFYGFLILSAVILLYLRFGHSKFGHGAKTQ